MAETQIALAEDDVAQVDTNQSDWHKHFLDDDEFDYEKYNTSLTNRLKQAWILIMATMQTIYMIRGLYLYTRPHVRKRWCKTKSLLCFQSFIIMYLVINEFTHRHIKGVFIILLFTQYSLFVTFCIINDSMITRKQEYERVHDQELCFNQIFRWTMHLTTLALFASTFWMTTCEETIYPVNFMFLVMIILLH